MRRKHANDSSCFLTSWDAGFRDGRWRQVRVVAATRSKHFIDTIKIIAHFCIELNATETTYPGADLRMIFKSASF
ncbi:MAG: hypothetical protein RLZZ398_2112 [Verrucomicrobiota bacterium]